MDRVQQIEAAIADLAPEECRRLADWFRAREEAHWDEKMDHDSAGGKLDFLFREAEDDAAQVTVRNWPPG